MRRPALTTALLALMLLVVLMIVLGPGTPQPVYAGRKLSKWAIKAAIEPDSSECRQAFEAIGTNGIPFYLDWIRYEPGRVRRGESKLAEQCNRWLHLNWYPKDRNFARAFGAALALQELGERAEAAIPHLLYCATNSVKKDSRTFFVPATAMRILAHLGRPAVPVILTLMTNENPRTRLLAVVAARECPDRSVGAQIRTSLQDPDRSVRVLATNSLREFEKNFDSAPDAR